MSAHGVCLDANNCPYGVPTPRMLKAWVRPPAVHRMVGFQHDPFFKYYADLIKASYGAAIVLTGQSYSGPLSEQGYVDESREWATLIQPEGWILANEWNVQHDATWPQRGDVGDANFIAYWNCAAQGIRSANPAAKLYLGGLFSEADMVGHIARVWPHLQIKPDGIDVHPYQETTDETILLLTAIRARFRCEVGVFEWNDSDPLSAQRYAQTLADLCEYQCWFCWSDGMLPDHGLVTHANRKHPTYYALQRVWDPILARRRQP